MDNTQLPAEVTKDIQKLAKDKMLEMDRKIKEGVSEESRHHFLTGYTEGVAAGATEYAIKLIRAEQEIESLTKQLKGHAGVSNENIKLLKQENEKARALLEKYILIL